MSRRILQPRDGVMLSNVLADTIQKSNEPNNFGSPLEFSQYNCVAFQVWWNGLDGIGTFKIQVSLRPFPVETDWVDKPGASIESSGASGTNICVVSNIGEKSLRVVWTPSAVTAGTVSAELMAKDSSGPGNYTKEDPLNVTASYTGLREGGRISEIPLNASTQTPLPAIPKVRRNAVAIQNTSGIEVKINYAPNLPADIDTDIPGYVGIVIADKSERQYDITEDVIIFAKAKTGTPTIVIEEIS